MKTYLRQVVIITLCQFLAMAVMLMMCPLAGFSQAVDPNLDNGPGGPILIISSSSNPFSRYYAEILRAEGFNEFTVTDLSSITTTTLAGYDIAILGEMPLTSTQATMLADWVDGGGKLIAMRPDQQLSSLLGLSPIGSTVSQGYIRVDTSKAPGAGIVNQTIQFHGTADLYHTDDATSVAALYSDATTDTTSPAVTLRSVGSNGGQAAAFTYDLVRSIVYTRQGNPAWAGQERDGSPPIRSDDLFYGDAPEDPQPNWIDLNKVAIPQADEQQRLLANMIIQMNLAKKPLPRFWYFPHNYPAVVVMTGDDHANGGTAGRFDSYMADSPTGCSVANWECIRSTSYIYLGTPLSAAQQIQYTADGFEVALHLDTYCDNWTPQQLTSYFTQQLDSFKGQYPSLPAPVTERTHCITWSDYTSMPEVELTYGIRLDTNYYYWPSEWISNRPGFFTGSGMPMRFAKSDGTIINVYQAATQMTDESGQLYPYTVNTLLDRATGTEGYYGAFTVNMHADYVSSSGSDAIISSAKTHGVPVISAKQMLDWLDGRNSSSFGSIGWSGSTLTFSVQAGSGANGLQAMVPIPSGASVGSITRDGITTVTPVVKTIKGVQYATFTALSGAYAVNFSSDTTPPTVSGVTPSSGATGKAVGTNVSATFSEAMDPATISSSTFELRDASNNLVSATVSYDSGTMTASVDPTSYLSPSTTYTATVKGGTGGLADVAGNPLASSLSWSFTTASSAASTYTIWPSTAVPANLTGSDTNAVELGVKFQTDTPGYITGIRFYKESQNTGTHVGNLWSSTGQLLASVTFTGESASGWQQASFSTPVAVSANTTYVASYHTNVGYYSYDLNYFTSDIVNSPLRALASGTSGGNGVFQYGATSAFPSQSANSTNYWVDVVFSTTASGDTSPPTVTMTAPSSGATVSGTAVTVTATASDNVGVVGVQFLLDGSPIGAENTASSYSISWDSTTACNGSHTLSARARDAAGNQTTSAGVGITVSNSPSDSGPGGTDAKGETVTVASGSRILWKGEGGYGAIWRLDSSDNFLGYQLYGPYDGWTPVSYERGSDSTNRLLWTHTSGGAAIWSLDSSDNFQGYTFYGPYEGWTPVSYARGSDGTGLLLWKHTSGQACVWNLDSSDNYVSYIAYGPYSEWSPQSIHKNSDGTYRMLWNHSSGAMCLWDLDAGGNFTSYSAYGPFAGWTAVSINQGFDGTGYLTWQNNSSGLGYVWKLSSTDTYSGYSAYGPYWGWTLVGLE